MPEFSLEERLELTRLVVNLLDSWEVPPADQIRLLALPADTRPRALKRYHEGTPLPLDASMIERIEHLVGIADALRTSFPRSAQMGAIWLNRRNPRFDDRTPLALMVEDGLAGIIQIRSHLDCAWDWQQDAARH